MMIWRRSASKRLYCHEIMRKGVQLCFHTRSKSLLHAINCNATTMVHAYFRERSLFLIINEMDQNLLFLHKAAKSASFRTHLTEVFDHTQADYGSQVFVFVDILEWPHDSIFNRVLFFAHGKK